MAKSALTPDMIASWSRTGYGHRVQTQDELMRAISRLATLNRAHTYVWRGIGNCDFRLSSSLYQRLSTEQTNLAATSSKYRVGESDMRGRERSLIAAARDWGVGLEMGGLATDLHVLATLQHHGIPTRLLDVTSNPMTALWFACQEEATSGALFAFDITRMPSYTTIDADAPGGTLGTISQVAHGVHAGLRNALRRSREERQPFVIRPVLRDSRMTAQEGLFLGGWTPDAEPTPGVDDLPLYLDAMDSGRFETLFAVEDRKRGRPLEVPFYALVIPSSIKRKMLDHLGGTYNRSRRYLFPDIDGFRDWTKLEPALPTLEPEQPIIDS